MRERESRHTTMVVKKKKANSYSCVSDNNNLLSSPIGILAFEGAAAMSRLVSLHRSLSEPELRRLRADTMRSSGVSYLTSTDQHFLFRLACAEFLSDLDAAAAAVSRFSTRSNSEPFLSFPRTYAELKSGSATTHIRTLSVSGVERRINQMEKYIAVAARLIEEMELEISMASMKFGKKPTDELKAQGKRVAKLKEQSLWCETFDQVVAIMSRVVLAIFARVCAVFSPFVAGLPPILISGGRMSFTLFIPKLRVYHPLFAGRNYASGPIADRRSKAAAAAEEVGIRNSCPIIGRGSRKTEQKLPHDCKKVLQPEPRTVGGSGLAMLYANIILSTERLMRIRCGEEEAEEGEELASMRDEIYRMLPAKLKETVRRRLRGRWKERGVADGELARGWREAVERILTWLAPVARDTERWQEERTMDRRQRLNTKPRVLALQTLMFSDREKVEMAIVEVLVGFSCICWYDGDAGRWKRSKT